MSTVPNIDQAIPPPLVDGVLLTILKGALPTVAVYTQTPAVPAVPHIFAKHIGGGVIDPRWASTRATIRIDSVAAGLKQAHEIIGLAHAALVDAEAKGAVTEFGTVARCDVVEAPREIRLPGQADNHWRFTGLYRLLVV